MPAQIDRQSQQSIYFDVCLRFVLTQIPAQVMSRNERLLEIVLDLVLSIATADLATFQATIDRRLGHLQQPE